MLEKQLKRQKKHKRVRAKIHGTVKVPRLCVFKSSKHIYAQLVDDEKGQTLVSANDLIIKSKISKEPGSRAIGKNKKVPLIHTAKTQIKNQKEEKDKKMLTRKISLAYEVGKLIAKKAIEKKIKKVVFDRGGYKYHGRVKAVAEGAREEGLKF